MKKLSGLILILLSQSALAQVTFQPIPLQAGGATVAACAQVGNLSFPIPVGATVYNCMIMPPSWTGTVAPAVTNGLTTPYAVGPITGNSFTIVTSAAINGTPVPAPGFLTTNP